MCLIIRTPHLVIFHGLGTPSITNLAVQNVKNLGFRFFTGKTSRTNPAQNDLPALNFNIFMMSSIIFIVYFSVLKHALEIFVHNWNRQIPAQTLLVLNTVEGCKFIRRRAVQRFACGLLVSLAATPFLLKNKNLIFIWVKDKNVKDATTKKIKLMWKNWQILTN